MNNILTIKNLSKTFNTKQGEIEAIKNISFDIKKGEIVSIVGQSGCGKSTLLNIISNLDKDYEGKIFNKNIKVSYMLQRDALLPWLNILDNACIGLKLENKLTKENIEYVKNLLIKFGLEKFLYQKPNNLSGGMRQRVALVRTLSTKPDLILLDEPLSALDYVTRLTITDEIYNIIKELNITTILITHDIAEIIF